MKNILFYLLLALSSLCCKSPGGSGGPIADKVKLPEEWPKDMVLTAYHGGGMVPESETVVITADSAYYEKWYNQDKNKYYFDLSKEERKAILSKFSELGFIKMKLEKHGVIHDKASVSLALRWDKHSFNFSNGATESIARADQENYFSLYQYITNLASTKVNEKSEIFTILLDESIFKAGVDVYFSFQSGPVCNYDSKQMGKKNSLECTLLPGKHEAQLNLVNPDYAKNGTSMYYANFVLNVDSRKHNTAKFFLEDKTIRVDTLFTKK